MEQGFIDIHSHILPGIDDGSKSWEQTEKMLQLQREEGVTHVIATPHFDMEQNYQKADRIRELVAEANEHAKKVTPEIMLYSGCEVLYSPGIIDAYKRGDILTMADSQYLLVEFFPRSPYREIEEAVASLIREGLIPIIAHVERYECLMREYDRLCELMKMGAVMQMNSRSLLGRRFDKRVKLCRKMIQNGFIHFLGSDCHNDSERPPKMREIYETITKLYGKQIADELTKNNGTYIFEKKYL